MESTQKKVVVDFIKAFSCAYSVTKNLGLELEVETDPLLLRSVVGFSSGISTMGDTCGVANGGVAVLGKKYSNLPSDRLYLLCSEYFRRLENRVGTPNCGIVHGGKHLARNFRRAILTAKTMKCVEVLAHGAHDGNAGRPDHAAVFEDVLVCVHRPHRHLVGERDVIDELDLCDRFPLERQGLDDLACRQVHRGHTDIVVGLVQQNPLLHCPS